MNRVKHITGRTAVFLFSIIWLLSGTAVSAQSNYPTADDLFVNDYAEVISSADEAQIRDLLAEYEVNNGVQMTVLTVRSLSEYNTGDATIEQFATNLFNEWGIGQASRNDGVLFLVAVVDRELRVELESAYGVEPLLHPHLPRQRVQVRQRQRPFAIPPYFIDEQIQLVWQLVSF